MRIARFICSLLLAAVVAGCESSTFVLLDGPLVVVARDRTLEVVNRTEAPVYMTVMEREHSTLADWYPCTNPETCDGLAPGQERVIRYEEILGYKPGKREAILYWWHLVPEAGGGFRPDGTHSEIIRL